MFFLYYCFFFFFFFQAEDGIRDRNVTGVQTCALPISVHLLGTCRMGSDPKTSVINSDHRTHDVKNLFLCDGSSLVTSGRGQPTMTIEALAFRAADRITGLAKGGEIGA